MRYLVILTAAVLVTANANAQRPPRGPAGPPPPAKAAAPIDLTGDWVSLIVDEWRFRVTPQKGDIAYMPINAEARRVAEAWDPDKDTADGNQCRAYGAVGVMQRPGRLRITWENDNTLRVDADAGTQTRLLHFDPATGQRGQPSWQGFSEAEWLVRGRPLRDPARAGFGAAPLAAVQGQGSLKVVTTNMLPGYIRKNGVPYSSSAVLTEYLNLLTGAEGDVYLAVTAMVADPVYLNQPFVRTYTFKKERDASGWDPTPCWPK
ncbi:MAG TPA: hypothetical protein VMB25_12220 [Bryobacteraceae bacterium]|nr:hypothetical protein [Bryobacteraceae bacterium]